MFLEPRTDLQLNENVLRSCCSTTAARIAGALAHELNNPLQGVLSLLRAYERTGNGEGSEQLAQVRTGLLRIAKIVEVLSVYYENLPRPLDRTTIRQLGNSMAAAFHERRMDAELDSAVAWDTMILCLAPEIVRLVAETFALQSGNRQPYQLRFEQDAAQVALACTKDCPGRISPEPWRGLDPDSQISGLYVLIDELANLSEGTAEFRFDADGLCGIRLRFRTEMSQA